jgi:geranylgeranyl pyrophosphate synthase
LTASRRGGARPAPGEACEEDLEGFLEATRAWVDEELRRTLPPPDAAPRPLPEAMHYAVFGGGKRLRPALVRLVCRAFGGRDADAAAPAAAVELVHAYSLVHDDLPCMDDDELRRGRPTVHVVYGEALAVLVGDALLTAAFEALARAETADAPARLACARTLAGAAGALGMVGGQALDLAGGAEDLGAVEDVHRRKTAALIAAAAELGALAAGAPAPERGRVREYGTSLGLLFQAVDDLLDVTSDARTLGKTPGKDAALERRTLVAVLGVEGARRRAEELARAARGAGEALGWSPGSLPLLLVERLRERRA